MKKSLFTIAIAALAIVGCSKVSPDTNTKINQVSEDQELPIDFQAFNYQAQTKGSSAFYSEGIFDVWSYLTGGDFTAASAVKYFKDEIALKDNVWKSNTGVTYYWPKTGKLSFMALYPKGIGDLDIEDGTILTDYEVTVAYSDQQAKKKIETEELKKDDNDILVASAMNQVASYSGTPATAAPVALAFKHALAKVRFAARLGDKKKVTEEENEVIKQGDVRFAVVINDIELTDVNYKGSLTFNYSASPITTEWTPVTTVKGNSGTIVDMNYDKAVGSEDFDFTKALSNTSYTDFYAKDYYVMPLNAIADATKITVKYTVYALNGNKVISKTVYDKAPEAVLEGDQHKAYVNSINDLGAAGSKITAWNTNTVYTYKLIIDPFEGEITFAPVIEDWVFNTVVPEQDIHKDVDN